MRANTRRFPYEYLLPPLILAGLVWVVPLIYSVALSMIDYDKAGLFVGAANYLKAPADPRFRGALRVSFLFAGGAALLHVTIGLLLALIYRRQPKQRAAVQTALLVPWVLSELAVALIWQGFLAERTGLVNAALVALDLNPQPWLSNPRFAMVSLWLAHLWRGLAFSTMIQMGGIQSLPENPIRAARIDGASRWMIFRYIVLPHQWRYLVVNALAVLLAATTTFSLPFALTGGGPVHATETLTLYAYRTAFAGEFQLGYAAAQGMVVLLLYGVVMAFIIPIRVRARLAVRP